MVSFEQIGLFLLEGISFRLERSYGGDRASGPYTYYRISLGWEVKIEGFYPDYEKFWELYVKYLREKLRRGETIKD